MKSWTNIVLAVVLAFVHAAGAAGEFKPLKLDTVHSRIGFVASTTLFDVKGEFTRFEVQVDGDPNKLEAAKVKVSIDTASVDTGIKRRDEHLTGSDFLDAKKYPKITFVSERIVQKADKLDVTGTLDLHGQKRKLTIPFKLAKGKNGEGVDTTSVHGKVTVNRNDYGIGASSIAAKISLQDDVTLDLLLVAFL